ncbi:unnamed protein product [Phytophthora fragariaefolia]|uniref:Unnamed protein product n=1 Tax=Phytophthora fragariaefolia TaxID=1490495 RepID=A0A9W7CWQ2_9STRA|nr:unnamed protein product [Phytophthora fragariaefolia]
MAEIRVFGGTKTAGHGSINSKLHELFSLDVENMLGGLIDNDVRVASIVKLFHRSIVKYTAYERYFHSGKETSKDKAVFTRISAAEWNHIVEMEAIVNRILELALAHTDKILKKTKALLCMEHRKNYRQKYATKAQSDDTHRSTTVPPNADVVDASESEMKLLQGEEVSERTEQDLAESSLYKGADALLDKWFALRVEWVEVAKHQYTMLMNVAQC